MDGPVSAGFFVGLRSRKRFLYDKENEYLCKLT
jgi:hypothetical protein